MLGLELRLTERGLRFHDPETGQDLPNLAETDDARFIPGLILGTYLAASTMRMTRTMMLEVLRQDYIRTAWAKGLRERLVILRHVIKNALIPVVTLVGLQIPIIVGGSVIMEQMFAIPGLGRLMIDALFDRDYPIISGINLFFAVAVMVINLLVDVLYAYLDPRVHYG